MTAIVPNERGELLLVHKTDIDLWALPGGGMDVGESMAETVVRPPLTVGSVAVAAHSDASLLGRERP